MPKIIILYNFVDYFKLLTNAYFVIQSKSVCCCNCIKNIALILLEKCKIHPQNMLEKCNFIYSPLVKMDFLYYLCSVIVNIIKGIR